MQISICLTGTPEGSQVRGLIFANDLDTQLPEEQPLVQSVEIVNVTSLTGEWYNFTMNFHATQNTVYWLGYSSDGYTRYYFDTGGESVSVSSQPKNESSSLLPTVWSYEGKSAMSLYALYLWAPPQPTPTSYLPGSAPAQTQSFQDVIPLLLIILAESGIMVAYRIHKKRNFIKKIIDSFAELMQD